MLDELVTLPVRVGVRVTRLWFRALEETFSVTSGAAGRVVGALASRGPNGAGGAGLSSPAPTREPATERGGAVGVELAAEPDEAVRSEAAVEAEAAVQREPPVKERPAPPPPPEPAHVSEEPELVEEFAEPGAAQGAGAEIHVEPPWDGYEQMNAKQVIARFATADPAQLAAVQLYEVRHRHRQTVLNAVERELRNASGSGSRTNDR